ncbi:MAG: tetratricopeptide repeat protein [Nitrospirae bacterium]|nr:tetratricopeptide repeat protein [Nitrospirota bacterium]
MPIFNKNKNLLQKSSIHVFIVIAAGVLAYSNTFTVPFHFDDVLNIVDNPAVKDLSNLWPPDRARWFGLLTFAINYKINGLNVIGYHIVNLAIHIVNALLVYWLVLVTLQSGVRSQNSEKAISSEQLAVSNELTANRYPLTAGISLFPTSYSLLALFSALLFVSHPIQTQAVTYIVQRFTSLATLFYLLSLVLYIKWRIQKSEFRSQNSEEAISSEQLAVSNKLTANRYLLYTASLVSAVLAMTTKEIAFTLPIIIMLYEFFFFSRSQNSESSGSMQNPPLPPFDKGGIKGGCSLFTVHCSLFTHQTSRFFFLIPFFLTMLIIPFTLIETDKPIGAVVAGIGEIAKSGPLSRWDYFLTETRVIMTYMRLLLFPVNQTIDYDYPISHSFFDPNVFLSFLFILSFFGLGVFLFYCSKLKNNDTGYKIQDTGYTTQNKNLYLESCIMNHESVYLLRLTAFGIFWFFITLSVESSVIPIVDVIFEHRVYLPSVGALIFVATFLSFVTSWLVVKWKKIVNILIPLFITIIIILQTATFQRNTVWRDAITLWTDVAKKNPANARAYNMIGICFFEKGDINSAILNFREAIRVKPDYTQAHSNLGTAYMELSMLEKAEKELFFSLYLSQYVQPVDNIDTALIHTSIGNYYFKKGLYDNAIKYYNNALKLFTENAQVYFNLGRAYNQKGHREMSGWYFNKAHTLDPGKY